MPDWTTGHPNSTSWDDQYRTLAGHSHPLTSATWPEHEEIYDTPDTGICEECNEVVAVEFLRPGDYAIHCEQCRERNPMTSPKEQLINCLDTMAKTLDDPSQMLHVRHAVTRTLVTEAQKLAEQVGTIARPRKKGAGHGDH